MYQIQSLRRIKRVKSNTLHVIISSYLEWRDVRDIRESTFSRKLSATRIFSENTLYRLEMNALEEDPTDGD